MRIIFGHGPGVSTAIAIKEQRVHTAKSLRHQVVMSEVDRVVLDTFWHTRGGFDVSTINTVCNCDKHGVFRLRQRGKGDSKMGAHLTLTRPLREDQLHNYDRCAATLPVFIGGPSWDDDDAPWPVSAKRTAFMGKPELGVGWQEFHRSITQYTFPSPLCMASIFAHALPAADANQAY
ncbi:hypothetical protein PLICRDRAFT_447663 [Plicaturopsis crispa FD-325 SS-3]|uniref:Uncharacterized protein n=1 Tax=Plicaturopsis crispa FD-325 SS-3 TaxID=944288 RepID=A0A0C9T314_PLICR|nr:hypothetical protein PLICRDRAFT_447663 [Plicaturopsis crispa FD-325 SS-3]